MRACHRRLAVIYLGKSKADEDAEFERRKKRGQRMVFVNRMIDDPDASWASADFTKAAREATARLSAAGSRRIAIWGDIERRRVDEAKVAGFLEYVHEASDSIEDMTFSPDDGDIEAVAEKALSSRKRPDGWLAFSDEAAMRVIHIAIRLRIKVPDELSVVGMNDVDSAAYFNPPLTSVRIPFRECGVAAVDIAQRLLDNPSERSVKLLLRHKLIERESCAPRGCNR